MEATSASNMYICICIDVYRGEVCTAPSISFYLQEGYIHFAEAMVGMAAQGSKAYSRGF